MDQNRRPDYYEGQYLGAADLDAAVEYAHIQRVRHQLGAHTWGIAAGLELRERVLPGGAVDVSVMPGVAWDGYGRTLVLLAPTRIPLDRFDNYQADTGPAGLLVKVWLRYGETATQPPAPGFAVCRPDGQFARVIESAIVEVGEPTEGEHGDVVIAGRSMPAKSARAAFVTGAPDLYDESVPHQAIPNIANLPRWLVPLGYVRWQKVGGQPGKLIARNDTGTPPDSDLSRGFRHYLGVVAETVNAADGIIRLRDRGKDPAPAVSHVRLPRIATDPKKPPENDLVWVEGHLHVLGDARVSGGKLEWRNSVGDAEGAPLFMRRKAPNAHAGKSLELVLGGDEPAAGRQQFVVGRAKPLDGVTAAGALVPAFTVRDDGKVGIGTTSPTELLTLVGQEGTRLEMGPVSAGIGWGHLGSVNPGAFAINQQSAGTGQPGADFALMRDRKLRVILGDESTFVSAQGNGAVIIAANHEEAGQGEVMRCTAALNVGIGTTAPAAKLAIGGDVALEKMAGGGPRALAAGSTLVWNDGTWLRLNQNLDHSKPIHGVHTPGLFAPNSLNVGGVGGWMDPGAGNVVIAGGAQIAAHTSLSGGAAVGGNLVVSGTIQVASGSTLKGGVVIIGGVSVTGTSSLAGNCNVNGNFSCTGSKNFRIPHPLARDSRRLVHAALEGPETAVFYRGEAKLEQGRATITLPAYFESLVRRDARSVQLTPIFDGDEPVSALAANTVKDGVFEVRGITKTNPSQRFYWEVKAVRGDLPALAVERALDEDD